MEAIDGVHDPTVEAPSPGSNTKGGRDDQSGIGMSTAAEPYMTSEEFAKVVSGPADTRHRVIVIPDWLRLGSPAWMWAGLLVVALGFGLIALTWGEISGQSLVYRQLPYLISGGFTALGLIVLGVMVVSVSTREADAERRHRQYEELMVLLQHLETTMSEPTQRR